LDLHLHNEACSRSFYLPRTCSGVPRLNEVRPCLVALIKDEGKFLVVIFSRGRMLAGWRPLNIDQQMAIMSVLD
jgi:hypothetical protein